MKSIRVISSLLILTAALGFATAARAANVQGILISASNESGATDGRLSAYEPTLRRILRFESYRFLGQGRADLADSESGRLSLGAGQQLELDVEKTDDRGIHVRVRWVANGRTLMNTGLVLRPGVPAVLGGPSTGKQGEVYAVILVGQ